MLTQNILLPTCIAAALAAASGTAAPTPGQQQPTFGTPVRLMAAGEFVKTEAPGYASPAWADVDGDGNKDLVVGQFNDGKMKVYRNLGDGELAAGVWLEAAGDVAKVPGVW